MRKLALVLLLPLATGAWGAASDGRGPGQESVVIGRRPLDLVRRMDEGPLKRTLEACSGEAPRPADLAIAHRGAPLLYPEHTRESYEAAARMGARLLECDVTFTRDLELVCRHSQCDLHTTTDILLTPLASRCTEPFAPARLGPDGAVETPASARCCTSDFSLEELRSLRGRRDVSNPAARTVEEYLDPPVIPGPRLDEPDFVVSAEGGSLMTHAESIALFQGLGVGMIPELKAPAVPMPFRGLTRQAYAQKLIDEYVAAGVPPERVWPQSFDLEDIRYWIDHEPEFGRQAVLLEGRRRASGFDPADPVTWHPTMEELFEEGVRILGPPIALLLDEQGGTLVPSTYARRAREAGLGLITWTLERPAPDPSRGGWRYAFVGDLIKDDGDVYVVLDALARDVGVMGVFSDWPATVTYYASCVGRDAPRR